ncbi:hypothetical protein YPPY54_2337, partial [Yersinia pestis PY-54]
RTYLERQEYLFRFKLNGIVTTNHYTFHPVFYNFIMKFSS